RLTACVSDLRSGDQLFVADWRGDEDELLRPEGPRLGDLLTATARQGVKVRGLLWRSHPQALGFNQEAQGDLARVVNEAGGGDLPGALERPHAARAAWVPAPANTGPPNDGASPPRSAPSVRGPAGAGRPAYRPGAAHLSGQATSLPLRPGRRAQHRPPLREG